jgi:hypothetical protein
MFPLFLTPALRDFFSLHFFLKKKSSQNVVKTIENDVEIFFEQFVVILVSGAFFLTSVHRKEGSFSDGLNKKKKKKKI